MMDDDDETLECPYEKSHQIHKSRMQFHMKKCRKIMGIPTKRCPYNAAHDVETYNYNRHCAECPDRANVENWATTTAREPAVKVPCTPMVLPEADENWDDEEHPTYDPTEKNLAKPIFRQCVGESKSVRKNFRLEERERFRCMDANVENVEVASKSEDNSVLPSYTREQKPAFDYDLPVRQPKGVSKTFAMPLATKVVPNVHGMGRGRAPQPVKPGSGTAGDAAGDPAHESAGGSSTNIMATDRKGEKKVKHGSSNESPAADFSVEEAGHLLSAVNIGEDGEVELDAATVIEGGDWLANPSGLGWTSMSQLQAEGAAYPVPEPDTFNPGPGRGRAQLQRQQLKEECG